MNHYWIWQSRLINPIKERGELWSPAGGAGLFSAPEAKRVVNKILGFLAQEGLQTSSDSGAVVVERC